MVYCYFVVRITIVLVVYLSSLCFGVLFCFYLRLYWSVLLLAGHFESHATLTIFRISISVQGGGGIHEDQKVPTEVFQHKFI